MAKTVKAPTKPAKAVSSKTTTAKKGAKHTLIAVSDLPVIDAKSIDVKTVDYEVEPYTRKDGKETEMLIIKDAEGKEHKLAQTAAMAIYSAMQKDFIGVAAMFIAYGKQNPHAN